MLIGNGHTPAPVQWDGPPDSPRVSCCEHRGTAGHGSDERALLVTVPPPAAGQPHLGFGAAWAGCTRSWGYVRVGSWVSARLAIARSMATPYVASNMPKGRARSRMARGE